MGKSKLIVGIVVGVVVIGLAIGGYFLFRPKTGKVAESVGTPTATPTVSSTPTVSPSSDCGTLTAAERTTVASWSTYTNATNGYSFKYPAGWTITETNPNSINARGTDSGETISFQVRSGEMSAMGFAEYTLVDTRSKNVACVTATESTYDGDENLSLIVDSFTKAGTQYVLLFSFNDIGASFSKSMVELQQLMVKTLQFS